MYGYYCFGVGVLCCWYFLVGGVIVCLVVGVECIFVCVGLYVVGGWCWLVGCSFSYCFI